MDSEICEFHMFFDENQGWDDDFRWIWNSMNLDEFRLNWIQCAYRYMMIMDSSIWDIGIQWNSMKMRRNWFSETSKFNQIRHEIQWKWGEIQLNQALEADENSRSIIDLVLESIHS